MLVIVHIAEATDSDHALSYEGVDLVSDLQRRTVWSLDVRSQPDTLYPMVTAFFHAERRTPTVLHHRTAHDVIARS